MNHRPWFATWRSNALAVLVPALAVLAAAGCDFGAREREQAAQQAATEADVRARLEHALAAAKSAQDEATAASAALPAKQPQRPPLDPPPAGLTAEELAAGWIALFDGATLYGWQPTSKADWQVKDGQIEVSSGEPGLLCTTTQFADYELRLDFRFAKGTNSGVFLHTPLKPTDPAKDCYELNIAEPDVSPFPTGSFVKRKKAELAAGPDTWHSFEVTMAGAQQVVKLNGETILEYEDPAPLARGYIGLQLNQGAVAFRRIRLRPLALKSIYNGSDLDGWKEPDKNASKFTVGPDGTLHVTGGRGYLESAGQYADFALQFDCRTNAPNLNSGIFFRCVPGQEMLGYECQIHNGIRDGDRSTPVDCGTGGIFRRQDARRVVADDLAWFHATVVTDGPHVSVWVNGYQVTDWTDTRAPDDNPRKGLRTAAGSLMIQGHDPTTNIDFRRLVIGELPARVAP